MVKPYFFLRGSQCVRTNIKFLFSIEITRRRRFFKIRGATAPSLCLWYYVWIKEMLITNPCDHCLTSVVSCLYFFWYIEHKLNSFQSKFTTFVIYLFIYFGTKVPTTNKQLNYKKKKKIRGSKYIHNKIPSKVTIFYLPCTYHYSHCKSEVNQIDSILLHDISYVTACINQ